MKDEDYASEIEALLRSQGDKMHEEALTLLKASQLSKTAKEKYVKDGRGDLENEERRVEQLRNEGIFLKSKIAGNILARLSTFVDSLLWSWYGEDVEKSQAAARKKLKQDQDKQNSKNQTNSSQQ